METLEQKPDQSTDFSNSAESSRAGKFGDKIFSSFTIIAGVIILLTLFGVALFLIINAYPAFVAPGGEIPGRDGFWSYIFPLIIGTLIAAAIAIIFATPIGIGIALFISHYAPRKLAQVLGYIVDLLAAVPSVVFGIWGASILAPNIEPVYQWLAQYLGWTGIFAGPASATGKTILTAGIVLAIMILPIIASLSREVFLQTPKLNEEAALALGATRWETIKMSVLPFGRPGVISAVMLGLGRALGETMAVAMVLSPGLLKLSLIQSGNQTIAADIALNFPESSGIEVNTLMAAGLVLFCITLVVNMCARWIINRHKKFVGGA